MKRLAAATAVGLLVAGFTATAKADEFLGSYVARISGEDHFASDGYRLESAAQMVRQDRANYHKFHRRDRDDERDRWFRGNDDRARLERMLQRPGAMSGSTRNAIVRGEPLIQVDVYTRSVRVTVLER
ncbi:MAG: hypothetical protein ACTHOP_13885 [Mesorhizobium sp.]